MNQKTPLGAVTRMKFKLLGTVAIAAMLGACSQSVDTARMAAQPMQASAKSELDKSTSYWAGKFRANPKDATAAISYASNLKAQGNAQNAFTVLEMAHRYNPNNKQIASEYGRLALAQNKSKLAQAVLANAYDPTRPDWRVVSAQGTVEAKLGNYKTAQTHFRKALDLSPDQPSVLNNLALAYALDGQANEAEGLLRKASEGKTVAPKVKQNLALILGMQGRFNEAKSLSNSQLSRHKVADNMQYLRKMVKAMPAEESSDQTVVADVPAALGGGQGAPAPVAPKALVPAATAEAPLRGTAKIAETSNGWNSKVTVADADISQPIQISPPVQ